MRSARLGCSFVFRISYFVNRHQYYSSTYRLRWRNVHDVCMFDSIFATG
jgi:hypothetical protein